MQTLLLICLLLVAGCGDPYDGPSEGGECSGGIRCADNRFQSCSLEGKWRTEYDCDDWGMTCDTDTAVICYELDGGPDAG